jgi:succinate dehydrogenase / fumarate reductase cytochrome b subunit
MAVVRESKNNFLDSLKIDKRTNEMVSPSAKVNAQMLKGANKKNVDEIPSAITPFSKKNPLIPNWVLKVIMAVTGTVFVGFILFHLYGNFKIFIEGRDEYNAYAVWLRHLLNPLIPGEGFLWAFRLTLFICLVLHVLSGLIIYIRARKARGIHLRQFILKRVSARTMIYSGAIILCFIIFHILDLTIGHRPFASTEFKSGDAYDNLIYSFSRPAVAIFYLLVLFLLMFHISHGVWSILNDFGGTGSRLRNIIFILAGFIGFVALFGNACIVLAVQFGVLHH